MFKKKVEDFICEKCESEVKGTGFTNHCSECLWSKHVDNEPGDRESVCLGMMKPIEVEKRGEEYFILHKCEKCGHTKFNQTSKGDDFDEVIKISLIE